MASETEYIVRDRTGAQKMIGYTLAFNRETKVASCWLDIESKHLNLHKVLHGGVVTTLLDSVSGFAASLTLDETGQTPFLSITLNSQFIAGAKAGRVTAVAIVKGRGRKLMFVDSVLRDSTGATLATSTGIFKPVSQGLEI